MHRQVADPNDYTLTEAGLSLLLAAVLTALPAAMAFLSLHA